MEAEPHGGACDVTEGGASRDQSGCTVVQPPANGTVPHHSTEEAPPTLKSDDANSSYDSLIDGSSTNEESRLLPGQPASRLCRQTAADSLSASPPPTCEPPPPSFTCSPPPLPPPPSSSRLSTCSRHHNHQSTNQKSLSSTRSHASFKSDAAHIREAAGDDCCLHCLLACLYCQLLSMCSALGECLACGVGGASCCGVAGDCCCCCVEAAGDAACSEEACQAVLDCGILEGCCGSSDFLEICLECCAICFAS